MAQLSSVTTGLKCEHNVLLTSLEIRSETASLWLAQERATPVKTKQKKICPGVRKCQVIDYMTWWSVPGQICVKLYSHLRWIGNVLFRVGDHGRPGLGWPSLQGPEPHHRWKESQREPGLSGGQTQGHSTRWGATSELIPFLFFFFCEVQAKGSCSKQTAKSTDPHLYPHFALIILQYLEKKCNCGCSYFQDLHLACLRSIQHSSKDLMGKLRWNISVFYKICLFKMEKRRCFVIVFKWSYVICFKHAYIVALRSFHPEWGHVSVYVCSSAWGLTVKEVRIYPQPKRDLTSRCLSLSDLTGSVTVKIADEGTWWFEE